MDPKIFRVGDVITLNNRKYKVDSGINRGGSGEVYAVSYNAHSYALKLFYPFYQTFFMAPEATILGELLSLQQKEYEFLATMSHPNIVTVIDHGMYELRKKERDRSGLKSANALPFILEELIKGLPIDKALQTAIFTLKKHATT